MEMSNVICTTHKLHKYNASNIYIQKYIRMLIYFKNGQSRKWFDQIPRKMYELIFVFIYEKLGIILLALVLGI